MDSCFQTWAHRPGFDGQTSVQRSTVVHQPFDPEARAVQVLYGEFTITAGNGVQTLGNTTAGAGWQNPGVVAGFIANQRHGIGADGGNYQFAVFSIGLHIAVFIDDLGNNMVLPHSRLP